MEDSVSLQVWPALLTRFRNEGHVGVSQVGPGFSPVGDDARPIFIDAAHLHSARYSSSNPIVRVEARTTRSL